MKVENESDGNQYPDLSKICRLCLGEEKGSIVIFEPKSETGLVLSIPMRVMACASLEVSSSDGLPAQICRDCRLQLEKSYLFRKKCQLSDTKIRKHVRLLNAGRKSRVFSVSAEDDDDDDLEFQDSITFIDHMEDDQTKKLSEQIDAKEKELRTSIFDEVNANRADWEETLRLELAEEEARDRAKWEEELRNRLRKENQQANADWKRKFKETMNNELDIKLKTAEDEIRSRVKTEQALEIYKEFGSYLKEKKLLLPEQLKDVDRSASKKRRHSEAPQEVGRSPKQARNMTEDEINDDETIEDNLSDQILIYDENVDNSENLETIYVYDKDQSKYIIATEDKDHLQSEYIVEDYESVEEVDSTDCVDEEAINEEFEDDVLQNDEEDAEMVEKEFLEPPTIRKNESNDKENVLENDVLSIIKIDSIEDSDIMIETGIPVDQLKTFKCEHCPQAFRREALLIRHKSIHVKGKSYQCPHCHKHFSCKSSLDRHVRIHTGEKPFTCDKCGKSFIQKEVLKRHEVVHTNIKPHPCSLCEKSFNEAKQLQVHINLKHMPNAEPETFKCHLCPKKFNHNSGLSRHLQVHSGVYFACSDCGRKFNDKSAIRRHVFNVHGKVKVEKSGGEETDTDEQAVQNILPEDFN